MVNIMYYRDPVRDWDSEVCDWVRDRNEDPKLLYWVGGPPVALFLLLSGKAMPICGVSGPSAFTSSHYYFGSRQ